MFERSAATVFAPEKIRLVSKAFGSKGYPICVVMVSEPLHAGHQACLRAARRLPGSVVIAAVSNAPSEGSVPSEQLRQALAAEGVDAVFSSSTPTQPPVELTVAGCDVTAYVRAVVHSGAEHVFLGEDDYRRVVHVQAALRALGSAATVHSVPAVRTPEGVPVNPRLAQLGERDRARAVALSASLVAGVHAAASGAQAALESTRAVLESADLSDPQVELTTPSLGPAPEQGDARLEVRATIGGQLFVDSCAVALS